MKSKKAACKKVEDMSEKTYKVDVLFQGCDWDIEDKLREILGPSDTSGFAFSNTSDLGFGQRDVQWRKISIDTTPEELKKKLLAIMPEKSIVHIKAIQKRKR